MPPKSPGYEVFGIYDEPEEGEELSLDSEEGLTGDYFDDLFEGLDADYDDEDQYA